MIDSLICLVTKAVGMAVDVKNDYIIHKELSTLAGNLALKCGWFLAIANAALIATKHINFSRSEEAEIAEQSLPIAE